MSLELFIALRYLRAKRKGFFAAVTSSIGVAGVTVGVAALITTLSVMNGFQADIERKIIGAQAHVTILGAGAGGLPAAERAAAEDPRVAAAAPFVLGEAIVTHNGRSMGVLLKGLDARREFQVNDLARKLESGSWEGIDDPKTPGIVIGVELADRLGADVGSRIALVSPEGAATPLGLLPKMERFRVVGLLKTGYYEYDSAAAWTGLEPARRFLGEGKAGVGLGLRLKNLDDADAVAARLRSKLGLLRSVRTYAQMNQTLFGALKLEKTVMFIILALITLVASLNIASTLILRSVEKARDVGLLKAMGATPGMIQRVFLVEGLLIGGSGVAAGGALGLGLCWIVAHYSIVTLPQDIYYIARVPVDVRGGDLAAVFGLGLLLTLLATVYPARRAAKSDPVEAIHYG